MRVERCSDPNVFSVVKLTVWYCKGTATRVLNVLEVADNARRDESEHKDIMRLMTSNGKSERLRLAIVLQIELWTMTLA